MQRDTTFNHRHTRTHSTALRQWTVYVFGRASSNRCRNNWMNAHFALKSAILHRLEHNINSAFQVHFFLAVYAFWIHEKFYYFPLLIKCSTKFELSFFSFCYSQKLREKINLNIWQFQRNRVITSPTQWLWFFSRCYWVKLHFEWWIIAKVLNFEWKANKLYPHVIFMQKNSKVWFMAGELNGKLV